MALVSNVRNDDFSTVYDFTAERRIILTLGGFVLLRKSGFLYVLQVTWLTFVILLSPYLFATGLITICTISLEKEILVEIFQDLCLFVAILIICALGISSNDNFKQIIKSFKSGVFLYDGENENILQIKRKYVQRIRDFNSMIGKLTPTFTMSKIFLRPLINLLTVKEDIKDRILNPYLPLPLYVPFNTNALVGFTVAFISHGLFFFFMYVIVLCHVQTYVSCAMQFTAQLEVLSFSLRKMESRAYFKLAKGKSLEGTEGEGFYKASELQECLLSCMQENIKHHHAILRLRKAVSPYIELSSSVAIMFFSLLLAAATFLMLEDPAGNIALLLLLVLLLFAYMIMSLVGQLITDKSSELRNSLYSTPWPICGKQFRALLVTMMANTQKPIVLRGRGFRSNISLENFADMVSLAYKIISILR